MTVLWRFGIIKVENVNKMRHCDVISLWRHLASLLNYTNWVASIGFNNAEMKCCHVTIVWLHLQISMSVKERIIEKFKFLTNRAIRLTPQLFEWFPILQRKLFDKIDNVNLEAVQDEPTKANAKSAQNNLRNLFAKSNFTIPKLKVNNQL